MMNKQFAYMSRNIVMAACAVVAGITVVCFLPPNWLGTVAEIGAVCTAVSAILVRIGTKTQPSASAKATVLMWFNIPEQPLAELKEGWTLTWLFASAAFLISLMLSVIVKAS